MRLIIALCAIPHVGAAQELTCSGQDPAWVLTTTETGAIFVFDRMTEMAVMQDDTAVNADHTRAMTLVGARDSGILVVTTAACNNLELQGTYLTQRAESPIILSGCCTVDLPLIGDDQ